MLKTSKRLFLSFFVLALTMAGLTVAADPALATYSPTCVANRGSAHHGGFVEVRLTHFAGGAKGTISAENRKRDVVLQHFTTYQTGNKNLNVRIPQNLPNGYYSFVVQVNHQYASFNFRVV